MTRASRHYVLAAGGTGGHLIPAFALATELDRRGHHVALVTDSRGASLPGKPDFLPAHVIPASKLGKNPLRWPRGISAILEGRRMAMRLYESFEPSAVIGFGGYPVFPALLGAMACEIPTLVHEQNAVLGRVNRFFARKVDAMATAYPEVARLSPKNADKVHLVGNPVRAEVLSLRDEPFPPFTADGLLRVLVTGGSQGARVLSEVVPDGLAMLPPALRQRLQVTPQARAEDVEAVRAGLADGTIDIVATDHAPHPADSKDREWDQAAMGMTGLETALSLVQSTMVDEGRLTWRDVARVMSEKPAEIGRDEDQGRPLAAGEPANLLVWDPRPVRVTDPAEHASLGRNSPFAGLELPGANRLTLLGGRPTVRDGAVVER